MFYYCFCCFAQQKGPTRSQCYTYGRSNLRRKLQASKKRNQKTHTADNNNNSNEHASNTKEPA